MLQARPRLLLVACAAAVGLAGCMTPTVKPKISQAVIDARAHRDAPVEAACPEGPLSAVSPVLVGFPFNDAELAPSMTGPLARPARWLACHADIQAVVRPDSDGHGTDADQDALARRRAEAVRDYLVANKVPVERIRIQRRGETEPGSGVLLIRAEGRRW